MSFTDLYLAIYRRPLSDILLAMLFLCVLWTFLRFVCTLHPASARAWMWINRVLCVCSVLGVLLITVFSRDGSSKGISFELFRLPEEQGPREEYPRMLLMNAFLFVPLGMSLGSSWTQKTSVYRCILYTVLGGFAVTFFCELLQLIFGLGTMEADDLVMNLAGVLLGMTHLPAAYVVRYLIARVMKREIPAS